MEAEIKERLVCGGCGNRFILTIPAETSKPRPQSMCPNCGQPLAPAPPKQRRKIHDSKKSLQQYLEKAKATASQTRSLWKRLVDSLTIDWPSEFFQLRRCRSCHLTVMSAPNLCASCGGPMVSVDPAVHLDDLDDSLVRSHVTRQSMARIITRVRVWMLIIGIGTVFVLYVALTLFKALFFSALTIAALVGSYYLCVRWINAKLRSSSTNNCNRLERRHKDTKLLDITLKDIVYPFFDRNRIDPFESPAFEQDELVLLNRTLDSRGLSFSPERLEAFLSSAALDRDYQRFAVQAERMTNECGDEITGYASLYPDTTYDGRLLPFLQQYLASLGQEWSLSDLLPKVSEQRQIYKQRGFEMDLELRKGGTGQTISINDVDRVDPFNFELLLGMIFESEGYSFEETPKSGDQGADVLLEKAGERTVVQVKLYSQPVGNSAVQEAIAAKTYFRCHHAMVITNNTFTASARELATRASVQLVERNGLIKMIDAFNRSPKDYHRLRVLMTPKDDMNERY